VVCLDCFIGQTAAGFEIVQSALFVLTHLPAEAYHIGGEDGRKFTSWC
jgi:hypothetical protein